MTDDHKLKISLALTGKKRPASVVNLIGKKFGRWLVVSQEKKDRFGKYYWHCRCECGNEGIIASTSLLQGISKSCGCFRREFSKILGEKTAKHGMWNTGFYKRWVCMKRRCFGKNSKDYPRYGGRGITVCERWLDFFNFKSDMYKSYLEHCQKFGEKNTTNDRIDNNGNYCKENCRWSTAKEQANNRKR